LINKDLAIGEAKRVWLGEHGVGKERRQKQKGSSCHPHVLPSSVRNRLKTRQIANLPDPSVRKDIKTIELGRNQKARSDERGRMADRRIGNSKTLVPN
jgi:hypothetical protein